MTPLLEPTPVGVTRADLPFEPPLRRGGFAFARTHLSGLSLHFWALLAYLFLATSMLDEYLELDEYRPRFLLGVFALLVAVVRGIQDSVDRGAPLGIRHATTGWLLAFCAASVLSTIWAYDFALAKDALIAHGTSLMAYFLILGIVRTRRELVLVLITFCAGSGAFLLLSFWEWGHGKVDYAQGVVRMMGAGRTYEDPNSFAATVAFALPLVGWVGASARSWLLRAGALAYFGLAFVAVFYTSSRSALVLAALCALFVVAILRSWTARGVAAVVLLTLGVALVASLSDAQVERIQSILSARTYEKEESTRGRIVGYAVGWRIFTEHPLLGVGPGNWSAYRQNKVDGDPLLPHNLPGQILATRGGLGTLAFLGFLAAAVVFAGRALARRRGPGPAWDHALRTLLWAGLFSLALLVVSGLAAHNLERPNWVLVPALLVAAVTCRREPWPEPEEPPPAGAPPPPAPGARA